MQSHTQFEQIRPLDRIALVLSSLASLDKSMYLSSIKSLIYIARHHDRDGGVTVSDLAEFLQVPPAAASRLATYWATNQDDTGHPLVQASIATGDRRRRLLHLTPNGEQFIKGLESALA